MNLVPYIFSLFGYEKYYDPNKDVDDKGTHERYQEALVAEYDYYVKPLIDNIFRDVCEPTSALPQYLYMMEADSGNSALYPSNILAYRQAVEHHIKRYWKLKGTKRFLEVTMQMIGFNVTLNEIHDEFGFDSPVTFDDAKRRWDMTCPSCTEYEISIARNSGLTTPLSPEELAGVLSIVTVNNPINAIMLGIWFDGSQII